MSTKCNSRFPLQFDPLTRGDSKGTIGSVSFQYCNAVILLYTIVQREEKLNEMTKETEQMRKHLMEADEESERLRMEEARVSLYYYEVNIERRILRTVFIFGMFEPYI